MTRSMYFAGPEGLSLEICTGSGIDDQQWIDPEVTALCGIGDEDLEALKHPESFERPAQPIDQPTPDSDTPRMMYPNPPTIDTVMAISDQDMWDNASEATPPVQLSPREH